MMIILTVGLLIYAMRASVQFVKLDRKNMRYLYQTNFWELWAVPISFGIIYLLIGQLFPLSIKAIDVIQPAIGESQSVYGLLLLVPLAAIMAAFVALYKINKYVAKRLCLIRLDTGRLTIIAHKFPLQKPSEQSVDVFDPAAISRVEIVPSHSMLKPAILRFTHQGQVHTYELILFRTEKLIELSNLLKGKIVHA